MIKLNKKYSIVSKIPVFSILFKVFFFKRCEILSKRIKKRKKNQNQLKKIHNIFRDSNPGFLIIVWGEENNSLCNEILFIMNFFTVP